MKYSKSYITIVIYLWIHIYFILMKFKLYYNLEIINIIEIYSKATLNFIKYHRVKLTPTRNYQIAELTIYFVQLISRCDYNFFQFYLYLNARFLCRIIHRHFLFFLLESQTRSLLFYLLQSKTRTNLNNRLQVSFCNSYISI